MNTLGDSAEGTTIAGPPAELVETAIGDALVYFRVEQRLAEADTGRIRAVAGGGIEPNAFQAAAHAAREAVRLFAGYLCDVGEALMPDETGVEFGFTFEAKGKAAIVPVILTGESSGQVALKVTAKWTRKPAAPAADSK
jgi:hypothetical protein